MMSVNITVNGKNVSYQKRNLLNDPEYERKEVENNRRKMRLLQVRNASKNFAKKVRENVEKEKERQLRRIEEIKEQELEVWRKNAFEQQKRDLLSSIFQIGSAHHAAKEENAKDLKKNKSKRIKQKAAPKKAKEKDKENVRNADVQIVTNDESYPYRNLPRKKNISQTLTKKKVNTRKAGCFSNKSSSSSSLSELSIESDSTSSDTIEISKFENIDNSILKEVQPETRVPQIRTSNVDFNVNLKTQVNKAVSEMNGSSEPNESNQPSTSAAARKKRFTQISEFIQRNKCEEEKSQTKLETSDEIDQQLSPVKSKSIPQAIITQVSPKKKIRSLSVTRQLIPKAYETVVSKSSSSSQSTQSANAKVQFFDYNNKYQKEYEQPASTVEVHKRNNEGLQMNAVECAALNQQFLEEHEVEMEKLKQKSNERCQRALEKEHIHRACADLTAKLNAISKQRNILPPNHFQFSSACLEQVSAEKQTKLNNAIDDILKRPPILTCAAINKKSDQVIAAVTSSTSQAHTSLNLGSPPRGEEINSLNSSDSYCSILLGYVNGQSKQISEDIRKYNKQNGIIDKEKANKLQSLLKRINRLRDDLLQELDKCSISKSTTDKDLFQSMADSLSEFRKEREHILISDDSNDSISKRENELKKKEAMLEKRLKEFYKAQKLVKKKEVISEEIQKKTVTGEPQNGKTRQKPNTFIQDQTEKEESNVGHLNREVESSSCGESEERESFEDKIIRQKIYVGSTNEELNPDQEEINSKSVFIDRHKVLVGDQPVEILIKVDNTKSKRSKNKFVRTPTKLSSVIQSPSLRKSRKKSSIRSIESGSTSYRSLPQAMHNKVDELLKRDPTIFNQLDKLSNKEEPPISNIKSKQKKQGKSLNPLLAHYIQRLLGMSRTSINTLGVTSSDIDTPSSSIVNTTANISAADTDKFAANRLERVQTFVEDNYTFLSDLEESLRQSNTSDSSLKAIETISRKSLVEKKSETKVINKQSTEKAGPSRPILKRNLKKHSVHVNKEINLSNNSARLTKTCTQRIAALTEMIDKVRKEKQKILETTFSSVSETGRNSTEYLELPDKEGEEIISSTLDTKNILTDTDGTAMQLEKNNSIGLSRDSGISISRPITVQETYSSSTEDIHKHDVQTNSLPTDSKKPKPPISITRYSPDLVDDMPHELSTIFEVETPATSRLNTSVNAYNDEGLLPIISRNEFLKNITYEKFPTFEEYVRLNQLDMSQFDPEFSIQFEKEFNEFIKFAKEGKIINYKQFTSFDKYVAKFGDDKEAAKELLESLRLANLSFKKFPDRKDYLNKLGISTSDLLDSQTLEDIDEHTSQTLNSSSIESLINIEKELKLRNILTKSFQQNAPRDNKLLNSTSSAKQDENEDKLQGATLDVNMPNSEQTSAANKFESIEDDLKRLGINWPSIMKKKTIETQGLSSSTSSGLEPSSTKKKTFRQFQTVEKTYKKTTIDGENNRQLNLREFLTKELLKRTTTSSSLSCSDDSIASSILRSIIGSMTPLPEQDTSNINQGLDRQKTSTPMATISTSSERAVNRSHGGVSSGQLFSGESQLSSVQFNNSSKDDQITGKKTDL